MLCDVHCHIDLFPDPESMVRRVESAGILTVAVSNTPQMYEDALQHLAGCRVVKPALGLHPLAKVNRERELTEFRRLLCNATYIGEIGMDGTRGKDDRIEQERIFRQVIDEAMATNCMLSVHSRRMEQEVFRVLTESCARPAILHWYTGSSELIDEFAAHGHYFSVNLAMLTHPSSRSKILRMPMHRVLTESDGPFAQVKGARLSPLDMPQTISILSDLWGTSNLVAEKTVEDNLRALATQNGLTLDYGQAG